MEDALCKALGWYFPLLAKFRVSSVEELIYRKYPYACPYCRLAPHVDARCKTVRGTTSTVNHEALVEKQVENANKRPIGLNAWQQMFQDIYPRSTEDRSARSTLGLMEELGELAEAMRVFDRYPKYFAGEAADVFSYLMVTVATSMWLGLRVLVSFGLVIFSCVLSLDSILSCFH